jgi:hypothetical protein
MRGAATKSVLAVFIFFAGSSLAFAQAGSTGGTIGKTDKSISGGEDADRPRSVSHPKQKELKARHDRPERARAASESAKPESTETPQARFTNSPTCTNVRLACEKTASKFGAGAGHCPSSFAECMQTGKWKSNFSYYEGLARR